MKKNRIISNKILNESIVDTILTIAEFAGYLSFILFMFLLEPGLEWLSDLKDKRDKEGKAPEQENFLHEGIATKIKQLMSKFSQIGKVARELKDIGKKAIQFPGMKQAIKDLDSKKVKEIFLANIEDEDKEKINKILTKNNMDFLDEGTFVGKGAVKDALKDPEFKALKGDEKAKALQTLKMGGSITTEIKEANAFLAAADAARDKGDKEFEFPKGSGKMHKVTLKRDLEVKEGKLANALGGVALLASLLLMNKINSNDPVIQRLQAEYEQAEPAQQDSIKKLMAKRLIFLDTGEFDNTTPMDENAIAKFIRGTQYGGPVSDFIEDLEDFDTDDDNSLEDDELDLDSPVKKKKFKELDFIEKLSKGEVDEKEYKAVLKRLEKMDPKPTDMIKSIKDAYAAGQRTNESKTCGCGQTPCKTYGKMQEDKQIKVAADQKFVIDLKHLMQKHGKEDTIKITKKLMKQLHDKGEVNIDGTKLMFKEADTQLALPEPPEQTANFLGDDNMDYEGGMAKAQMLKMKNYAKALCDMIDDETQLEAWVQAKLTKASDYMSSIYHYLDYQQTKNLDEDAANLNPSMMDTDEALVSILMGEANLAEETAEQVVDGLSNEDFKKAALMMVRGADERVIAKFVLSATTLDEASSRVIGNPPKIDWEEIEPDAANRPDYQEGTIYGTSEDGRQWAAHGSYTEFDGFQVIGDLEEI